MNGKHTSLFQSLPIFAVYAEGKCVFASPRFFEQIKERECLSDIAQSGKRFVMHPPWRILVSRFSLKNKKYVFLIFAPFRDGCAPTEAETELYALTLTEHLQGLLACTDTQTVKPETLSPRILVSAIANGVANCVCECATDAPPPDGKEKPAQFAPRSLTYAISILLAIHYGNREPNTRQRLHISLCTLANEYQIRINMPTDIPSVFIKDLVDALAEAGGFTVAGEDDGFLFSIPTVRHHAFSLRTHPENEIADIMQAVFCLFADGYWEQE